MSDYYSEDFVVEAEDGVSLRGTRYYGKKNGPEKGTALCLHGLSSDSNGVLLIAEKLASVGIDVIAPDMRGHGYSDACPNKTMNEAQFASDVARICLALKQDSFFLVTLSYGGNVGLEMLNAYSKEFTIEGMYSFAPPWLSNRLPLAKIFPSFYGTFKYLRKVGRLSGFTAVRQASRQKYVLYEGQSDFYMPLISAEVKSISWLSYARLLINLKRENFFKNIFWEDLKEKNVHLFLARSDYVVSNEALQDIVRRTGWSCYWLDGFHVSLMFDNKMSSEFIEELLKLRAVKVSS